MTIFCTKADPISYIDLHNHLLTYEFLHKASRQSIMIVPILPTPTQQPSAFFKQCQSISNSSRMDHFHGRWRTNNHNGYNYGNHGYGSSQNFGTNIYGFLCSFEYLCFSFHCPYNAYKLNFRSSS